MSVSRLVGCEVFFEACLAQAQRDAGLDMTSLEGLTDAELMDLWDECEAFVRDHLQLIRDRFADAGRDFWRTRNRGGAGFWDGGWPVASAATLTEGAHAYGERSFVA